MTAHRFGWFLSVLVLGILAVHPPTAAQSEPQEAEDEAPAAEDAKGEGDVEGSSIDPGTRRLLAQLNRLQRRMDEELELSPSQKRDIRKLFDEQQQEMKSSRGSRDAQQEAQKKTSEEMGKLREELESARVEKDQEKIRDIRSRMRDAIRQRRSGSASASREFLQKVEGVLEESQRPPFRKIVDELGLSGARGETLQTLLRAVMHPDIGLTPEQRRKVQEKMREAFMAMSPDERASGDMTEAAGKFRADIMKELSPEQRAKVETILKSDRGEFHRELRTPSRPQPPQREQPAEEEDEEENPDE